MAEQLGSLVERMSRESRAKGELCASTKLLDAFGDDVASHWCPSNVGRLTQVSSLEFLRDYVSKSLPCIIEHAIQEDDSTALTMTLDELVERCDAYAMKLTVDVTPDGHGDVVRTVKAVNGETRRMFVKPHEKIMTLSEFKTQLRNGRERTQGLSPNSAQVDEDGRDILLLAGNGESSSPFCTFAPEVLYYSRQNDCLRTELKPMFDSNLVPPTFSWAEDAFGTGPPDAVNMWIGDERAVSSMHKDHYENLFYVLEGEKVFTLCPPCDAPFLYQGDFESGSFQRQTDGSWVVVADEVDEDGANKPVAKWIEADVDALFLDESTRMKQCDRFPLLARVHPIKVTVRAGEMLYLPALWFHRVTQTCETIGINYWFDMNFNSPFWCYFNFMQQLETQREI
jgi:peptidyl-lysine (3S)-dioxygenase / protease